MAKLFGTFRQQKIISSFFFNLIMTSKLARLTRKSVRGAKQVSKLKTGF